MSKASEVEDDPAATRATLTRCLEISPSATSCLDDLSNLESREGRCDEVVTLSRRAIAIDPQSSDAYDRLAQALFALGEPLDAVQGALEAKWKLRPHRVRVIELSDEAGLAVLRGDFESALRVAREYEQEVSTRAEEDEHFTPQVYQMLIDLEVGRNAEVVTLARDYLRRRAAWVADQRGIEPTISILAVQAAAGARPPEFERLRSSWRKRDEARISLLGETNREAVIEGWCAGYALFVTTPAEAADALAHWPNVPENTRPQDVWFEEAMGRTYRLAGKLDQAIETLRRVNRECNAIEVINGLFSTRAANELGLALEAKGDRAGACDAYRQVVARWGSALPASLSARQARERLKALGCSE